MENLKELTTAQQGIGEEIDKAYRNYKKDSFTRKTAEYVEKRINALQRCWQVFNTNHEKIILLEGNEEHPYIEKKYFDQVKNLYQEYIEALQKKSQEISEQFSMPGTSTATYGSPQKAPVDSTPRPPPPPPPTKSSRSTNDQEMEDVSDRTALRSLNKKYGINRSILVRFIDKTRNDLTAEMSIHQAKQKGIVLDKYWTAFNDTYIELLMNEDENTDFEDEYTFLEENYNELMAAINEKAIPGQLTSNPNSEVTTLKVKPINIPTFTGDYRSWETFNDLFTNIIHQNKSLSNVQKMQYLKTNIGGEASKLIGHLSISTENYTAAWNTLTTRYNNKRTLTAVHLETLMAQPVIYGESSKQIKSLHDTTRECMHALRDISAETIVLHILLKKLDKESHKLYENSLKNPRELQSLDEFLKFLELRFQTLEAVGDKRDAGKNHTQSPKFNTTRSYLAASTTCLICNEAHKIYQCKKYCNMNVDERFNEVKKNNLCRNCLSSTHTTSNCKSHHKCGTCKNSHHTSLHKEVSQKKNVSAHVATRTSEPSTPPETTNSLNLERSNLTVQSHMAVNKSTKYGVLLATAMVQARAADGHHEVLRVLCDQGSQATFITEETAQRLQLPRKKIHTTVGGIGSANAGTSNSSIQLTIKAMYPSSFTLTTTALVLHKLTTLIPEDEKLSTEWTHLNGLILADKNYNKPGKIDMVLGADAFGDILLGGVIKGQPGAPVAQETEFGWILSGRTRKSPGDKNRVTLSLVAQVPIDELLRSFWEIEEIGTIRKMTSDEKKCEDFFSKTHHKDETGRYVLKLPFRDDVKTGLGKSRNIAVGRLLQMEKRFKKDPELKQQYTTCIQEYLELGHMKLAQTKEEECAITRNGEKYYNCCYLPHHAVFKKDSTTTKLRVVFDASRKTTNGTSLNDKLMIGPTIQEDLVDILMRWRKHKIVFTTDIQQMYRQIRISDQDSQYQRIVWRNNENEPIRDYNLLTVTFGTASAPHSAIRTLKQVAMNGAAKWPIGAETLENDFYVDDGLSGANTVEEVQEKKRQLIALLQGAKFQLRKWASNDQEVLKDIPDAEKEIKINFDVERRQTIKTLGMQWNPACDNFSFKVTLETQAEKQTKRVILSEVAKLYDPLGWLAPVVIKAKILLQGLWLAGINWDDALPQELTKNWLEIRNELPALEKIRIPRWTNTDTNTSSCELHGFCDASVQAYAAVVYLRVTTEDGVHTCLITAKTRVAPVKQISLPRLELCGAELLTKLLKRVSIAMKIPDLPIFAWTDSTIVLAWLRGHPNRWKTFIANRVSTIQSSTNISQWSHVRSEENPADVASRGILPSQLESHSLWWNGPHWLKGNDIVKTSTDTFCTDLEVKKHVTTYHASQQRDSSYLLERYSDFNKLVKVTAWCSRFFNNLKKSRNDKFDGPLRIEEIEKATTRLIRMAQNMEFEDEMAVLRNGNHVNKKSKLASLDPFVDGEGVLRVGGRLHNADLSLGGKHPIIIPHKGPLTTLIIDEAHRTTLHGGSQLTLSHTRQLYWIIHGRQAVKLHIHRCIRCVRFKAKFSQQLMGSLPTPRVSISRPFTHTGTDYCGPIDIRMSKGRGNKTYKGYIAIFVCLSTKAIHIEAVSDLTAEAFIAAFKRFVGRRGHVAHMYSDNATNFVSANKILGQEDGKQLGNKILDAVSACRTEWHFIPPASPHFGGLWEAGVKSIKHHLKRTIGDTKLTFEELTTVLIQIEACLNSRPLCPLSDDPNDAGVLTPGHFLIGNALLAPPEPNLLDINLNRLNRWQLCNRIKQEFWRKWRTDYLTRLQQRPKWLREEDNIKRGDLVLIKNEQTGPMKWPLGRVTDTHEGKDRLVRVVTVKFNGTELKRPITKICRLPISEGTNMDPENDEAGSSTGKDSENPSRRNLRLNNLHSMHLIAIIIFFGMFAAIMGQNAANSTRAFQTTPFTTQPGIFFEQLGTVNLINNQWKMVVFYDLKNYHVELETLKTNMRRMEKFCAKITGLDVNFEYCRAILPQFNHQVHDLEERNKILYTYENMGRQKRSVVLAALAIGGVAALAYNVINNNVAQRYENDINNVKNDERHLLELLKQQTSIIESTASIMKKQTMNITEQFIKVGIHIDELNRAVEQLHQENVQERVAHLLTIISLHSTLILVQYQNTQNALLDVVMDVGRGKINPLLLSPAQLRNQLELIRENLPKNLKIPDDSGHLFQIYKLLSVSTAITVNTAIFEVTLPIITQDDYQLFHLIPVPSPHGSHFVWIEPRMEHLIVNIQRDQYYPIQKEELGACILHYPGKYLCTPIHPIYSKDSDYGRCEIGILNHELELHSSCQLRSMEPTRVWIPLHTINTWIYVMDQEYSFDVICNEQIFTSTLNGSGILNLQPNCTIKQPTATIHARNVYTSQILTSFIPSTNITQQLMKSNDTYIRPSTFHIDNIINPGRKNDDLDHLQEAIAKLRQREQDIVDQPWKGYSIHDIHHYIIIYISIIATIVAIIYLKCKKARRHRVDHSTFTI